MVVPVLITSCQVSEKWKSGPVAAHTRTTAIARMKVGVRPDQRDTHCAKLEKALLKACMGVTFAAPPLR